MTRGTTGEHAILEGDFQGLTMGWALKDTADEDPPPPPFPFGAPQDRAPAASGIKQLSYLSAAAAVPCLRQALQALGAAVHSSMNRLGAKRVKGREWVCISRLMWLQTITA